MDLQNNSMDICAAALTLVMSPPLGFYQANHAKRDLLSSYQSMPPQPQNMSRMNLKFMDKYHYIMRITPQINRMHGT